MKALSKTQKISVVLSVLWETIIITSMSVMYEDDYIFESGIAHFVILSIPIFLYWAGVWIWGFGYLKKLSPLTIFAIRGLKFLTILVVMLGIYTGLKAFAELSLVGKENIDITPKQENINTVSKQEGPDLTAEQEKILYDYGVYYGGVIFFKQYCGGFGYELKYAEKFNNDYANQIKNLTEAAKNLKIDKEGHNLFYLFNIDKYRKKFHKKALEGFNLSRKMLIIDKIATTNPRKAAEYLKNLSEARVLVDYGYLVPEKEACIAMDDILSVEILNNPDVKSIINNYKEKTSWEFEELNIPAKMVLGNDGV